jgi:hypothetical protein
MNVPGWGVDARPENRPGVPQELEPPRPIAQGDPHLDARQSSMPRPLLDPNRSLTPVYSAAVPPRGLSGMLRRAAYKYPTYRARRWMLLMLADRIDVLEHNGGKLVGGLAMLALGFFAVRALRNR